MASNVAMHRCRFLESRPAGVGCVSLHPSNLLLAATRDNGNIELWSTGGQNDPNSQPWLILATIPGNSSVSVRSLCWASVKSKQAAGVDGCRLFGSSLDGRVYECDFEALRVSPIGDSNAGGVWSIAAFNLQNAGGASNSGCILAAGCEDGSVRLLRVSPHQRELDHIVGCPGTDGRVLSVSWHPSAPVLFAGTGSGAIRGWDFSSTVAAIVNSEAVSQQQSKKRAAAKAIAKAADGGSGSDSSDSDSSDDDDDTMVAGAAGASSVALTGRGATVGPRPLIRMQIDSFGQGRIKKGSVEGKPGVVAVNGAKENKYTAVWSLAVLSDMSVISGDSRCELQCWDGRTGTLTSSTPLVRCESDIVSVAAAEDANGSVTIVAGSLDGKVAVVTRASNRKPTSASSAADGSEPTVPVVAATPGRWVVAAHHRVHSDAVRAVGISRSGNWIVSASADAHIASVRPDAFSTGEQPRQHTPFGRQSTNTTSIAPQARLLAVYEGAAVQVWRLPGSSSSSASAASSGASSSSTAVVKRGAAASDSDNGTDSTLMLQIDTPALPSSGPTFTAPVPEVQAAACAISDDGQWLCYAGGAGRQPRLVHLQHQEGNGRAIKVSPTYVELPETLESVIRSSGATVSRLRIASLSASAALLIAVLGQRVHVCVCAIPTSAATTSGAALVAGKKRQRSESNVDAAAGEPVCAYLYSVAIPLGHGEPSTSHASQSALAAACVATQASASTAATGAGSAGGRQRPRSATFDSGVSAPADDEDDEDGTNGDNSSDDDEEEEEERAAGAAGASKLDRKRAKRQKKAIIRRGAASAAAQSSSASGSGNNSGIFAVPVLIEAKSGPKGVVSVAITTATRHVHVYCLSIEKGQLIVTLPRHVSIPTALSFTDGCAALIVAYRDATISFYSPSTGRLAGWSPPPGEKSRMPKAMVTRLAMDHIRSVVPVPSASSSSSEVSASSPLTTALKLLCFCAVTTCAVTFQPGSTPQQPAASPAAAAADEDGGSSRKKKKQQQGSSSNGNPAASPIIGVAASVVATVSAGMTDKYTNIAFAGSLSSSTSSSSVPRAEAVVVEVPWSTAIPRSLPGLQQEPASGSASAAYGKKAGADRGSNHKQRGGAAAESSAYVHTAHKKRYGS